MSSSRIGKWDERYRAGEQVLREPAPLVVEFARDLPPGLALDLACGPGRNALYLAEHGWRVTAVDGSSVAIDILRTRAQERGLAIDARIADLEADGFVFPDPGYDLILSCLYLQRTLIPGMKSALRPGGLLILIALLDASDPPEGSPTRACPGELPKFFPDWRLLHYLERNPGGIAELVAEKPR